MLRATLFVAVVLATLTTSINAQVNADELVLWQEFYNATNGRAWKNCRGHYDDPCKCGVEPSTYQNVVCENGRITAINLRNNYLSGELPVETLNKMTALTELILLLNDNLEHPKGAEYDFCVDLTICKDYRLPGGVLNGDSEGITKCKLPDYPGTSLHPCSDTAAWKFLYDALDGPNWNKCSNHREVPCLCGTYPELDGKKVTCTDDFSSVVLINLKNNNLNGELPVDALVYMQGLETLDITRNAKVTSRDYTVSGSEQVTCLNLPFCNDGTECAITEHIPLCDTSLQTLTLPPSTLSPTASPTKFFGAPAYVVRAQDIEAWQSIYEATGGEGWKHCKEFLYDPCRCTSEITQADNGIVCQETGMTIGSYPVRAITEMNLQNNSMSGTFPLEQLDKLTELKVLNLGTNAELSAVEVLGCVEVPKCVSEEYSECSVPSNWNLCSLEQPSQSGITPKTRSAVLWKMFYDATNGVDWKHCSEFRESPCGCNVDTYHRVFCLEDGTITKIILRDNNLDGFLETDQFLELRDLNHLNLESNPSVGLVSSSNCLRMDECVIGRAFCYLDSGIDLCSVEYDTFIGGKVAVPVFGYTLTVESFLLIGLTVIILTILGMLATYCLCGCCCFFVIDDDGEEEENSKEEPEEEEGGRCIIM